MNFALGRVSEFPIFTAAQTGARFLNPAQNGS